MPPFIITEAEIDELLARLKGGLDDAWEVVQKRLT